MAIRAYRYFRPPTPPPGSGSRTARRSGPTVLENGGRMRRILVTAAAAALCTVAAGSAIPENLLRNSSFKLAANGSTPDYWDLHHAAALQFRDLHAQYNLVDTPRGPVPGARVLRITNSESGFPFLYLLSRQPDSKLPAGNYVFSVYARADAGNLLELAPALDRMDLKVIKTVSTEWRRYYVEYRVDDVDNVQLSPLLILPSHGTYWISAPKLESGGRLTPYAPAAEDANLGVRTAAQRSAASDAVAAIALAAAAKPATGISANFEFSLYTDEAEARLKIGGSSGSSFNGTLACSREASSNDKSAVFSSSVALNHGQATVLEIPITGFSPGEHSCSVSGGGESASAKLMIQPPSSLTVRVNQFRNTLEVNKSGYHVRGVMVGGNVPPEWYFSDIVEHGINTLFFYPREDANGSLNTTEMDAALSLAEKHGLKVIVGPPVAGQKNESWKPLLDRYCALVDKYRNSPAIIGWFVVDEPQAWTLRKNDLVDIYNAVKAIDPYRLVFINWGSDDVPATVGTEPHGTLAATDLYSIDYYPFANGKTSLENYALRTIRAQKTGMLAGRPGHSWLQLYGYLDVNREPTGDELNFMAYVNLLYGGNYSYWQTKSNAKPTWDRLGRINEEIRMLTNTLMLNPDASELRAPTLIGHYLYSAWKAEEDSYLIVLHVANETEPFAIDIKPLFGSGVSRARDYFDNVSVEIAGSTLKGSFNAYATRVYKIN